MKLYIIAGEASGDLHAANLMKELLKQNPETEFRYWGGDRMESVSDGLVKHIRDLAFMGFLEVLMNIRTITKNIRFCKEDIEAYQPDALILVDYPGFNLRIAEWAKSKGIKVYYYISPQVWAWKQSRVHKIRKVVDHMFVILPFEEEFYARFGFKVEFVGHPLIDAIEQFREEDAAIHADFRTRNDLSQKPVIALLPGSRKQEIKTKLPIMLAAVCDRSDFQIVVAGAPSQNADLYKPFMGEGVKLIFGETYQLLSHAEYAVVTSGTATLETALFNVPEVVCYKGSALSYAIAKRMVKIKFISLVNLIMNREVVKELIQKDCTAENICTELNRLINEDDYRNRMLEDYSELRQLLGEGGASRKVAQSLLKTIRS